MADQKGKENQKLFFKEFWFILVWVDLIQFFWGYYSHQKVILVTLLVVPLLYFYDL